ncbi:hypothetical protein GCM10011609_84930 [Lentzea pudingi]|uniref:Uncharacterized protein n=1 Tax=Lentzea pudingi TaxID=1789439 RepID=A0ABQ2IT12_9PSEU|nr:hypothetical protein [Lentzea pudingi]GGN28642.1 hypothetical protein GCM10011609_84930 [Lentzea pudingi]
MTPNVSPSEDSGSSTFADNPNDNSMMSGRIDAVISGAITGELALRRF